MSSISVTSTPANSNNADGSMVVEAEKRRIDDVTADVANDPDSASATKKPNLEFVEGSKPSEPEIDLKTLSYLTNPTRHDFLIDKINKFLAEFQEAREKVILFIVWFRMSLIAGNIDS
jgi:hypothetical protein